MYLPLILEVTRVETHLGSLDALRGFAILGVLLVHTAILTKQSGPLFTFAFTGQRGVQLFYMVSAFTLCLSLDSRKKEHQPLLNFFIRRFFRIAPMFYIAIAANLLLSRWAPEHSPLHGPSPFDLVLGVFFLNGVSPIAIQTVAIGGWSIAIETTFYVVLPLLHRYFRTIRQTMLLFLVSGAVLEVASWRIALHYTGPVFQQYFAFLWFPVEFPVFVLGLLTYACWVQYIRGRGQQGPEQLDLSRVLLLASFMLYCGGIPFHDVKLYFSSFAFLPLILALTIHPWPALVNPVTRLIGKISYSLYLLHPFAILATEWVLRRVDAQTNGAASQLVMHRPAGLVVAYGLVAAIALPLSVMTWKFIEQPGIRLGRRWIARLEGRREKTIALTAPLSELADPENTRDAQF